MSTDFVNENGIRLIPFSVIKAIMPSVSSDNGVTLSGISHVITCLLCHIVICWQQTESCLAHFGSSVSHIVSYVSHHVICVTLCHLRHIVSYCHSVSSASHYPSCVTLCHLSHIVPSVLHCPIVTCVILCHLCHCQLFC